MLGKELLRRHVQRHVVYRTGKTVTFIRSQQVFHWKSAIPKRDDNLLRLTPVYARIVRSLGHKERGLDLVGLGKRRSLYQQSLPCRSVWIAHALIEHLAHRFPIWGNRFQ